MFNEYLLEYSNKNNPYKASYKAGSTLSRGEKYLAKSDSDVNYYQNGIDKRNTDQKRTGKDVNKAERRRAVNQGIKDGSSKHESVIMVGECAVKLI